MNVGDVLYPKRKESPKRFCGKLLWALEKCSHNFKHFSLRNKYSIEILFILLYFIEQAIFIYMIYSAKDPLKITTYFVLILLSTMAIEKMLMELRFSTLKEYVTIKLTSDENLLRSLSNEIEKVDEQLKETKKSKNR